MLLLIPVLFVVVVLVARLCDVRWLVPGLLMWSDQVPVIPWLRNLWPRQQVLAKHIISQSVILKWSEAFVVLYLDIITEPVSTLFQPITWRSGNKHLHLSRTFLKEERIECQCRCKSSRKPLKTNLHGPHKAGQLAMTLYHKELVEIVENSICFQSSYHR